MKMPPLETSLTLDDRMSEEVTLEELTRAILLVQKLMLIQRPIENQRKFCRVMLPAFNALLLTLHFQHEYMPSAPFRRRQRRSYSKCPSSIGEHRGQRVGAIWRPEVSGTVNNVPVSALADTGSCIDVISESFARRHNLQIDRSQRQEIKLPKGMLKTVGKTLVIFRFTDDATEHPRWFHILKRSYYEVVLGREFLNMTETCTTYKNRIQQRLVPCIKSGNCLFLLGDPEQDTIKCTINEREGKALADTGSDLMLISGKFARNSGFRVRRERRFRRHISFIDGSRAFTDGMVLSANIQVDLPDLPYGAELDYSEYVSSTINDSSLTEQEQLSPFVYDLHVLEHLHCDIILSNHFIHDHEIPLRCSRFTGSQPHWQGDHGTLEDLWEPGICVIRDGQDKLRNKIYKRFGRKKGQGKLFHSSDIVSRRKLLT